MPFFRRRRKKLFFLPLAVLLALVLLEGATQVLRLIWPEQFRVCGSQPGIALPPDPRLMWGMLGGNIRLPGLWHLEVNSRGWRGPEVQPEKKPGAYRIMFLGDSSVWGDGVHWNDSFPFLTAQLLQQKENRAVETLNLAVPGYSSTQCRMVFEDNVDIYRPDAVVIGTIWSDIIARPWTDADMLRKFSSEGYRFESVARLALRKSAIFSWLEARIEGLKGVPDNRQVFMSTYIGNVQPSLNLHPRVPVEQHLANLQAICAMSRERKMDICLLLLHCDPRRFNWPPDRLKAYRDNFRIVAAEYDTLLVDVSTILPQDPDELTRLFLDGIHPAPHAHRLIAEALTNAFAQKHGFAH